MSDATDCDNDNGSEGVMGSRYWGELQLGLDKGKKVFFLMGGNEFL